MKKALLLINYTGRKGGGPLDAYEITKALLEKGICVGAVLSEQIENVSLWEELPLEKLIKIPTYHNVIEAVINSVLFPIRQKRSILKGLEGYDVKFIYSPMGALWTSKINKLFPSAKTGIVIHDPKPHSGDEVVRKLRKDTFYQFDYLYVHSKKFVGYVSNKYSKPTFYLPLGNHNYYKNYQNKISIINYDSDSVNYLFFGRISKYKGLEILARAYQKVTRTLKMRCTLSIIGSGDFSPYESAYKELDNVRIINRWIRDEETESVFIGENLICICPYTDATQSGVALIAMDYGIPLIVTNTGGMEEQVEDHKTGILVKPSDADSLANAMVELAENEELRKTISRNQIEHMKEQTWGKTADALLKSIDYHDMR